MEKVSIITVCYNSRKTIRATIESVARQTYENIEYIVIDGGSTDGTIDIVSELKENISDFISEPDRGIYDAMNKGITASNGDVVGFLNSDDVYADKYAIARLMDRMKAEGSDTVFADLVMVDPQDTDRMVRYYDSGAFSLKKLRFGWMPAHPTFLAKRDVYLKHGLYSLNYKIAADYEMIVRLLYANKVSYAYLSLPVVKMRAGGLSTRGIKSSWTLNREIVKACRHNGLVTCLPLLLFKIPQKLLQLSPNRFMSRFKYSN